MKKLVYVSVALMALLALASCNKKNSDGKYVIETAVYPEGAGTVSGAGTYAAGTTVTLQAKAAEGYEFVEWDDNLTEASRTISVSEDAMYIAMFREKSGPTPTPGGDLLVEFYHYGTYYNSNCVNYELYITDGELDEEGYMVGEGALIGFDINAPLTSTATAFDAGNYEYEEWTDDANVKKFTYLDGYYDEDYEMPFPSYVYFQSLAGDVTLKFFDGGTLNITKNGNSYTFGGTLSYYDYETGERGSYTLNYTAVPEFYDYEDQVAELAKSSVKKACLKKAAGKIRRR